MKVYLDSSVALRRLLNQAGSLSGWNQWKEVYASTLLRVEILRAIDRLRLLGFLNDVMRVELVQQVRRLCETIYPRLRN